MTSEADRFVDSSSLLTYAFHMCRCLIDLCGMQGQLATCFADCAEEYEAKLDKLKYDIAQEISKATADWNSRS